MMYAKEKSFRTRPRECIPGKMSVEQFVLLVDHLGPEDSDVVDWSVVGGVSLNLPHPFDDSHALTNPSEDGMFSIQPLPGNHHDIFLFISIFRPLDLQIRGIFVYIYKFFVENIF